MVSTQKVLFPWKSEYSVQDASIDSQHQRLVALVNDLYAAMAEREGRAAVHRILIGLTDYTRTHFSYEERQMERVGYPAIQQHKEYHRKLLQRVELYVEGWNLGQSVNIVELAAFLKDWLLNHIGQTDRPLAEYLRAQR
jgi:hemerythrin-like metal-binding protein